MVSQNAQTTVCSIAELVEAILLFADLSPLQLLIMRGVNKTFDDVILHALPFRRALFLEPDESTTANETDPAQVRINPFLEKIYPSGAKHFFNLVLGRTANVHVYTEGRDVLVGQGKVCKRCYSKRIILAGLDDDLCYLHLPLLETRDEEDYFAPAQWWQDAIWRKMYATRPILPIHIVDATPLAHKWELPPMTTLGEIVSRSIVGGVIFKAPSCPSAQ